MPDLSPSDLQRLQQIVDHNPRIQDYLRNRPQRLAASGVGPSRLSNAAFPNTLLDAEGITLPHDYAVNPTTGQIEKQSFVSRNPWALPVMVGAGMVGGTALAAGLSGAGAAAGTGGTLLGEGGTAAGLSSAGATPGLIGASASQVPAAITAASTVPKWVGPAASLGVGAVQHFAGGSNSNGSGGDVGSLPPDMQAILTEFARRVTAQGPLADATTAQALAGLPRTK